MAGLYLDTSAIGRVILGEPDASAIRQLLATYDTFLSSELFVVELRRLARLNDAETEAELFLAEVDRTPITADLLQRASRIEPSEVRALDAIHLTTAVELRNAGSIAAMLTYDHQLQVGCQHHGIAVETPVV